MRRGDRWVYSGLECSAVEVGRHWGLNGRSRQLRMLPKSLEIV